MTLFIIIFLLVAFSLTTNFFKKNHIQFSVICFSVLIVLFFYFFLAKILFNTNNFIANEENNIFRPCGNYYNLLVDSFCNGQLNIFEEIDDADYKMFSLDTSLYKNKTYLYFGITPVLLFYLPFHLITNLYLTDKFTVFILSCLSFILSAFLIYTLTKRYKNISLGMKILSFFLIGFCNLLPFLIINSFIYQVCVITANILLLGSFCLFHFFLSTQNTKFQNIFVFFISLFLCLSVGARPHYILFIPIFFFAIIYLRYKESAKMDDIFKTILIFLIPCIIYGGIIALYNYFRFDSIFEFGWKYQQNEHMQMKYVPTIKDFLIGLKNNFLLLPNMNNNTFFSLTKASGHSIGNEYIAGVLWTCPIVIISLFIPNFLKRFYLEDKKTFIFLLIFVLITIISIIVTSFFGMIIRYIFEFLSLMIILSIVMFLFYINEAKDKILKNFLKFSFVSIFIFSIFINISLLFCKENFWIFQIISGTNYLKIIKLLF